MTKTIAILIPCYNESQTIKKVITDFQKAFAPFDKEHRTSTTVYVYDNNSTDNSAAIAKQAGALVVQEHRQGKGNVVRSQFRQIEADAYVMVDGDDTYEATDAPEMVRIVLEEHADMVIGDRLSGAYFTENKRRFHGGGNVLVRNLINTFFDSEVNDIMTGFRAFSYGFVKTFPVLSSGFEIETEMTIHAVSHDLNIREVQIDYRDRPEGSESKLNTVSDGIRVITTIARLVREYRPLRFFTIFALILAIIGIIFAIVPITEFFRTGLVSRFPTLIVSGFIILVAVQMQAVGFILDLTAKKHRELFEVNLNLVNRK